MISLSVIPQRTAWYASQGIDPVHFSDFSVPWMGPCSMELYIWFQEDFWKYKHSHWSWHPSCISQTTKDLASSASFFQETSIVLRSSWWIGFAMSPWLCRQRCGPSNKLVHTQQPKSCQQHLVFHITIPQSTNVATFQLTRRNDVTKGEKLARRSSTSLSADDRSGRHRDLYPADMWMISPQLTKVIYT